MKSIELQPLMHDDVEARRHAAGDAQLVEYDSGYPPLPDAVGTEV